MQGGGATMDDKDICFTRPVFFIGAVGGVAIDVVTLYFSGFSAAASQSSWLMLGIWFRIAAFMALAGVLACLFSRGNYRTAFAIGVAAPSIIVNLGASVQVQKPREMPAVMIPSIPAPTGSPGSSLRFDAILLAAFAVPVAEAQGHGTSADGAAIGQVRVSISGILVGGDESLVIADRRSGATLAVTKVPSQDFDFAFAAGEYVLVLRGSHVMADPVPITIRGGQRVVVQVAARTKQALPAAPGVGEFWRGATQRFEKASDVKQQSGVSR
jgi:hypothetical protein